MAIENVQSISVSLDKLAVNRLKLVATVAEDFRSEYVLLTTSRGTLFASSYNVCTQTYIKLMVTEGLSADTCISIVVVLDVIDNIKSPMEKAHTQMFITSEFVTVDGITSLKYGNIEDFPHVYMVISHL